MSAAPSSVQEARKALGQRLRDIRRDSGLSARALAERAGWHESKCSKLQSGLRPPTDADIRTWTELCGVPEQAADLIAIARGIEGMYVEWRRLERAGLKQAQESVRQLFARTRRFRMYQSWVIPGMLQTAEYTRAVLNTIVALRNVPDDVEASVAVRMERQQGLHSGDHRFAILIEEWVLRTVIGSPDIMAAQLGHIIAIATLPSVSLGIIPMGVTRGAGWPVESFTMYDDAQVNVELVSAHLTVTQPGEIAEYGQAFAELASIAVYGTAARSLVTAAIDALG
ncbi:helix-turn-helix transcriptional regulator [Kitasatospora sp. NPDC002040]|uniref:helix-turn-helix domain-containing protein n=1 Tax=Kitasatospora sp. NPDC002040 TaxID=3154661 RepID=UPI003324A2C5